MWPPGWDSLESVKRASSAIELTTIACWALMLTCEVVAHFWRKYARRLEVMAVVAIGIAILGEYAGYRYDHRKEDLYDSRTEAITRQFQAKLLSEQQRADQLAKEAEEAEHKAQAAENADAVRSLTAAQISTLKSLLAPAAPQELYFVCSPDSEAQAYFRELAAALSGAGWKIENYPYNWGRFDLFTPGVQIWVGDAHHAPRGAAVLQAALKKIGVDAPGANFIMLTGPDKDKFALYVGPQRRK